MAGKLSVEYWSFPTGQRNLKNAHVHRFVASFGSASTGRLKESSHHAKLHEGR